MNKRQLKKLIYDMQIECTDPIIRVLTLSWMSTLAPALTSIDAVDSCSSWQAQIRAVLPHCAGG